MWINGWRALRAVYNEGGIERGSVPRNGTRTEGVDGCSDLNHMLESGSCEIN